MRPGIAVLINIAWHMVGATIEKIYMRRCKLCGTKAVRDMETWKKTMSHDDFFHPLDSAFFESISQHNEL